MFFGGGAKGVGGGRPSTGESRRRYRNDFFPITIKSQMGGHWGGRHGVNGGGGTWPRGLLVVTPLLLYNLNVMGFNFSAALLRW